MALYNYAQRLLLKNDGEFEAAILSHVKTIANILIKNLSTHQSRWVLAAVMPR